MPGWAWFVVAVVVLAIIVGGAMAIRRQRSVHLRERFGPEYDRTVSEHGGRSQAESDLVARRKRSEQLDIRPLEPAARQRFMEQWQGVQARFVDDPGGALSQADVLVLDVMRTRGYPADDFEQREGFENASRPHAAHRYS